MSGDEFCLDRYRQNAAMVQVYFEQLNFEAMEEVPVYLVLRSGIDTIKLSTQTQIRR